jgi:predicted nucleic acid-binding protein
LCASVNLASGGFLVFGLEDKTGKLVGIDKAIADEIVERLAKLCRSGVEPFNDCSLLSIKPHYLIAATRTVYGLLVVTRNLGFV